MENVGLFPEFQNYKMAATSCYIFLLACVASVSVWFREQREMFGFGRAPRSLLRNSTKTLAKQATFLFFPVILACARVLLWRLAIALEQMLTAGEVYFRLVMSSKPPSKPRVELIFFTVVYSFLDSLLRVSQSLPNSFLYLGKLHQFPSLRQPFFYEPSVLTFRYFGDRISWKRWCWNENDGG